MVRFGKYIVRYDLLVQLDVAAGSSRRTVQVNDNRLLLTRRRPVDVRNITYIAQEIRTDSACNKNPYAHTSSVGTLLGY
jgi:hypothetical protein